MEAGILHTDIVISSNLVAAIYYDVLAQLVKQQIANLSCRFIPLYRFKSYTRRYAVCPGGEGVVLKTIGCKRLAGSNPVYCVKLTISPFYIIFHS